jgi:adenosine deaminase
MSLRKRIHILALVLLLATAAPAQNHVQTPTQRTAQSFEAARKLGPVALNGWLRQMPKGSDLHMHLSGAIYAETFLKDAAEDGLCIDTARLSLAKCTDGLVPAASLAHNQPLYDKLINSLSMRSYFPTNGWSGHDQFFSTFSRFGAFSKSHTGEWLDEVATRAASQNEQYLEIMNTPDFSRAAALGRKLGYNPDLAAFRKALLDGGLRDEVATATSDYKAALADKNSREHCGTPAAEPACSVKIRFLYQILRAFPPEQVFAQTLLGFETIAADPDFVGINFVQPEDDRTAMTDYTLQMKMLDYLHGVYPQVHITLHAGELTSGLVPPDGLHFHIRQAIELGHAERIGHGVDVGYEDHPDELLKEMAAKHIMVEINLTSNDVILGVSGRQHPLPLYRRAHVPVALSTDDEGVSRIDLTHEYTRAAEEFGLTYPDLKQMVRTGLQHAFLPGASLWARADEFTAAAKPCAAQPLGAEKPTVGCKAFLDANQKAAEEWELEHRFREFEAKF